MVVARPVAPGPRTGEHGSDRRSPRDTRSARLRICRTALPASPKRVRQSLEPPWTDVATRPGSLMNASGRTAPSPRSRGSRFAHSVTLYCHGTRQCSGALRHVFPQKRSEVARDLASTGRGRRPHGDSSAGAPSQPRRHSGRDSPRRGPTMNPQFRRTQRDHRPSTEPDSRFLDQQSAPTCTT